MTKPVGTPERKRCTAVLLTDEYGDLQCEVESDITHGWWGHKHQTADGTIHRW